MWNRQSNRWNSRMGYIDFVIAYRTQPILFTCSCLCFSFVYVEWCGLCLPLAHSLSAIYRVGKHDSSRRLIHIYNYNQCFRLCYALYYRLTCVYVGRCIGFAVSVQPLLLGNQQKRQSTHRCAALDNLNAYRKRQIFSWSFNLVQFRSEICFVSILSSIWEKAHHLILLSFFSV